MLVKGLEYLERHFIHADSLFSTVPPIMAGPYQPKPIESQITTAGLLHEVKKKKINELFYLPHSDLQLQLLSQYPSSTFSPSQLKYLHCQTSE